MAAAAGKAGAVDSERGGIGQAAVTALAAGCDLLITTSTFSPAIEIEQAIVEAVQSGTLAGNASTKRSPASFE